MNFPDEIWIDKNYYGGLYVSGMEHKQKYIRADLVPISCGGTLESFLDKVDPDIRERAEQFIEDIKSGKIKKRTLL